jgi:hypothetical protein
MSCLKTFRGNAATRRGREGENTQPALHSTRAKYVQGAGEGGDCFEQWTMEYVRGVVARKTTTRNYVRRGKCS